MHVDACVCVCVCVGGWVGGLCLCMRTQVCVRVYACMCMCVRIDVCMFVGRCKTYLSLPVGQPHRMSVSLATLSYGIYTRTHSHLFPGCVCIVVVVVVFSTHRRNITPLHVAVMINSEEVAQILLEHGANVCTPRSLELDMVAPPPHPTNSMCYW
jgi:Ankyrin repeat